jgi:uncharacterized membrane protein YhaH (DUF805 family)
MLGAIKYNLMHLLDFSGRDARQTFWYYVLFLVVLNFIIGLIVSIPLMVGAVGTAIEAAQAGVDPQAMQAQMMGQMAGALGGTLWVSLATNVATALLMLAAFVRRLHDSDKSGWWALLPLVGLAANTVVSIRIMDTMQEMMRDVMIVGGDPVKVQAIMERQQEFAAYGMIGWIAPLVVIGFGILRSTDGPNRFGDAPVRF